MSSDTLEHPRIEELCALASIGEISPSEYQELSEHLRGCASCQEFHADVFDLAHAQLPLAAAQELQASLPASVFEQVLGTDYKARFAARARERGIEVSPGNKPTPVLWPRLAVFSMPKLSLQHASFVVIIVLLTSLGIVSLRWTNADARNGSLSSQVSEFSGRSSLLQEQVETLSQNKQRIEADFRRTRSDSTEMAARLRALEEQVKNRDLSLRNLRAQLDAADVHRAQTEQELSQAQRSLLASSQEIAKLRTSHSEDDAIRTIQQVEIAELSHRTKELEEVVDKQQKLLSVEQDVHNLMAARSLHITDVFDVDGKGKKKPAFGRIFYTEGKSLVFYAFDLEVPKVPSGKHSFQAWGQLADSSTSAVNLGIFYVDDLAQKRWMLKFDNPEVLMQISAVFVTVEPHGGRARPTGQKLMYAYLGHEPNHP